MEKLNCKKVIFSCNKKELQKMLKKVKPLEPWNGITESIKLMSESIVFLQRATGFTLCWTDARTVLHINSRNASGTADLIFAINYKRLSQYLEQLNTDYFTLYADDPLLILQHVVNYKGLTQLVSRKIELYTIHFKREVLLSLLKQFDNRSSCIFGTDNGTVKFLNSCDEGALTIYTLDEAFAVTSQYEYVFAVWTKTLKAILRRFKGEEVFVAVNPTDFTLTFYDSSDIIVRQAGSVNDSLGYLAEHISKGGKQCLMRQEG